MTERKSSQVKSRVEVNKHDYIVIAFKLQDRSKNMH